jgi:hypothetical protein
MELFGLILYKGNRIDYPPSLSSESSVSNVERRGSKPKLIIHNWVVGICLDNKDQ